MQYPGDIDFDRIRQLARLARDLGLSELTSEEDGVRVTVTVTPPVAVAAMTGPAALPSAARKALPRPPAKREPTREELGLRPVTAPMMGVFYSASSPDAPAYVDVGAHVEEGDIVGLIEAMKVFNEITAEFGGEVVEIAAGNHELVGLGQPLMWIRE